MVQGGETAALARLEASFLDEKWVAAFEKPSTNPAAFQEPGPSTTVLSPYLKFGCLSARLFHTRLLQVRGGRGGGGGGGKDGGGKGWRVGEESLYPEPWRVREESLYPEPPASPPLLHPS